MSSFTSIRSWVLGLLDHATILEPPAFRDELVAWLDAISNEEHTLPADPWCPPLPDEGSTGAAAAQIRPGAETSRRLRRLLAVIGWLAQVGEAPTAEAAQRFGMDEQELVAELELAACCGTPPYTPDTLMEIEVSEHSVPVLPPEYARPRRLTPAEGFAVAASARLLLAVPGPTTTRCGVALAKLDAALGSREVVGLDVDAPEHLAAVRAAADVGAAVSIDYLSGSRDELTTRVVEPVQVITIDGHWYLDAYCHRGATCAGSGSTGSVRCATTTALRRPPPARAGPAAARDVRAGARRGGGAVATGPRRRVGARIRAGPCGGP